MTERYIKTGRWLRLEIGERGNALVRGSESGVAERSGSLFRCHPVPPQKQFAEPAPAKLEYVADEVKSLIPGGVVLERLTAIEGTSWHVLESGRIRRSWEEQVARASLSLVSPDRGIRVAVDLGATRPSDFDLSPVGDIANALSLRHAKHLSNTRAELSPLVAAQLWVLLALHRAVPARGPLLVRQGTHPDWQLDGNGGKIRTRSLRGAHGRSWPNEYRPSYRVAPVAMPFHVDAILPGNQPHDCEARVVATLEPFRLEPHRVKARVLVRKRGLAAVCELEIPRERLAHCVVSVGSDKSWFPYAAGSWGALAVLDGITLRLSS